MKKYKKTLKITGIVLASIIVLGLVFLKLAPSSVKLQIVKALSKKQVVRDVIEDKVGDNFEEKVRDADFKEEEIVVPEEAAKKLTGFKNIVLFGVDARGSEFDSETRSDTIMIVSINNDTGAIRMASLYRDTIMRVMRSDGSSFYGKVNSAYTLGGVQAALSTLKTNLDLNIDDYVVVNFSGLAEIIDLMGGVDIKITDLEMRRINKIGSDMQIEGVGAFTELTEWGDVHLDGMQATAYCRIRDAAFYDEEGNDYHYDYGRTARQRYVISKLVDKAKSSGISKLLDLAVQIMNMNTSERTFMKTSLQYDEIMDLIPIMIDYKLEGSTGFPYTQDTPIVDGNDYVVPQGLAVNVTALHAFLFDDPEYVPSQTVQEINDYIIEYTGVQPKQPEN